MLHHTFVINIKLPVLTPKKPVLLLCGHCSSTSFLVAAPECCVIVHHVIIPDRHVRCLQAPVLLSQSNVHARVRVPMSAHVLLVRASRHVTIS